MYYIKKPIPILAIQIPENFNENWIRENAPQWFIDAYNRGDIVNNNTNLIIKTIEGPMMTKFGNYIIRGVKGELYPCKRDIFEESYIEVEQEEENNI